MQRHDEAYLLSKQVLGDSDWIVTYFTRSSGKLRGVARAGRRSRRRFGGAFEPWSRVRVRWRHRAGRDLQRIEDAELVKTYAAMQAEPEVFAACAVMSELASAVSHEEDDDPKTFRLIGSVLDAIEAGVPALVAVRYFEFWLLRLHGVWPELDACGDCGGALVRGAVVTPHGAGVRCRSCAGGAAVREFGDAERAFLAAAAKRPPGEVAALPGMLATSRCGGALEALLRVALQGFLERNLKTYRHLHAAAGPPTTAP